MTATQFKIIAIKAGSRNGWDVMAVIPELKKAVFQKSENEFCYTTIDVNNASCVWGHYGFETVAKALNDMFEEESK